MADSFEIPGTKSRLLAQGSSNHDLENPEPRSAKPEIEILNPEPYTWRAFLNPISRKVCPKDRNWNPDPNTMNSESKA